MIKLRLWKRRQDTPGPVDLRFTPDPGIILELLRPREPTPGSVTLQFGRYEPPEYPTYNGTLQATLPTPGLPELTLAAEGESAGPPVMGTLQADLPPLAMPELTLDAIDQTLRGDLLASLPAPSAPVSLTAEGAQNLDLPDADGVAASMPSRNFQTSQTRLATAQQEMDRTRTRAAPIQTSALPVTKGHGIRQQQSEKLETSRRLPDQHGQKLGTSSRIGHADAVRIRRAFTGDHQQGIRLARSVQQSYAETVKFRAVRRLSEQPAIAITGTLTIRANQGAKLALRLTIRQTEAIYPPPGLATWPPPIDPEPPAENQITLRFCRKQDGSTTLIFGCPDEKPDPGDTIIIPIREIYTVINTLTLTELDGTPVPAEDFSASIDADSWTWSWSTRVPASALAQVRPDSGTRVELIATINGEPLRVLVEGIQRERKFGESWLRVSGRGRAAFLAAPLAPVTQYTNDSAMTAQQALNATMTTNGVPIGWTLDWRIEDWQVPAGIFSHNGTWIDAAKRIAEAGGSAGCSPASDSASS